MEMTLPLQARWEMMERYVRGEGSPEERALVEERMLLDDAWLELYMDILSAQDGLPELPDPVSFAEQVLMHDKIKPYPRSVAAYASDRPKRWYERTIVHYTIAASVTMLFLFTGTFDRLQAGGPEHGATPSGSPAPSYSAQLVEKTTGWIDSLLNK